MQFSSLGNFGKVGGRGSSSTITPAPIPPYIGFSNIVIAISAGNVVGTATSDLQDLSTGSWGFEYGVANSAVLTGSIEVAGAVASETITVPLVDLGSYTTNDTLDIFLYYTAFPPGIGTVDDRIYVGSQTRLTAP